MEFRPEAAQHYQEQAQQILKEVKAFPTPAPTGTNNPNIHVSHVFTPDQILSSPEHIFLEDEFGIRCGLIWNSQGTIVGWKGSSFDKVKRLAQDMAMKGPLRNLVSEDFALELTCDWMRETLERRRADSLPVHFLIEARRAVRQHELWFPIFRTYSHLDFQIGDVAFRTISKAMMDDWQSRAPSAQKSEAEILFNKYRAKFQGLLAACVQVTAEPIKASELAQSEAANALSLLSFLSPANYSSRRTNFGVLLGFQVLGSITELIVTGASIESIKEAVNDKRRADWIIQAIPTEQHWVLPALHDLASNRSTEFRKALYDALILHSRQAQARQVSDKLIFALTALESMFLRDSNEPIQKNLAERMAFLVGRSVEERKAVVKNVTDVYKVRSAFIHHGASPKIETPLINFCPTPG